MPLSAYSEIQNFIKIRWVMSSFTLMFQYIF